MTSTPNPSDAPLTLPLFPLPSVVLFPGMVLPLHIFEPRYQQMMHDILTAEARFGVLLCKQYNPDTLEGEPFDVGTIAEVVQYEALEDGRFNVITVGSQRFRIESLETTGKPYLQGEVTLFSDESSGTITRKMMTETTDLFQEARRITHKILNKPYKALAVPDNPECLSFFIAENLRGSLVLKQELLEMTDTKARLCSERDVLRTMVKNLAVRRRSRTPSAALDLLKWP